MPANGVPMVLFLAAASVVAMIVFLTQYRTHRSVALIAFVATAFIVVTLCASMFMGGSFVTSSFGNTMP
jgi:hypothetical protein